MKTIELPCLPGDEVLAYFGDDNKTRISCEDLHDCYVKEVSLDKDYPEPIFTVICKELADYRTFFLNEFGKTVFTKEQYYNMLDSKAIKDRMLRGERFAK